MAKKTDDRISLDREEAALFLQALVEDPFLAVVVAEDGEVTIYSKDLEPDHLERIKNVLTNLHEGASDGEEQG
jgi:hypothetical protein